MFIKTEGFMENGVVESLISRVKKRVEGCDLHHEVHSTYIKTEPSSYGRFLWLM